MQKKYNKKLAKKNKNAARRTSGFPAIAAIGGACGIAATPVSALELGDINVLSSLGQPLRASIAYALNPNEQVQDYCIFLQSGVRADGLPMLSRAKVRVTDGVIILAGRTPIREPMLALQLSIKCPYTAHLQRNYTLMVDPALPDDGELAALSARTPAIAPQAQADANPPLVRAQSPDAASAAPNARPSATSSTTSSTPPRSATPSRLSESVLDPSSRYQVQPGDTLSGIVARVKDRSIGLWPAAHVVFGNNPQAFIDGDMNLLIAGSWIDIPDFDAIAGSAASLVASAETPTATVASEDAANTVVYGGATSSEDRASVPASTPILDIEAREAVSTPGETREIDVDQSSATTADPQDASVSDAAADSLSVADTTDVLRPGDIVVSDEVAERATTTDRVEARVIIPDTVIEVPQATASNAAAAESRTIGTGRAWLLWLAGAGLAIIAALVLFGRRIRERYDPGPTTAPAESVNVAADVDDDATTANHEIASDVDYEISETPAAAVAISLDADLGDGSGLHGSSDVDVAQDFGFSASSELTGSVDLELPDESAAPFEQPTTDIIAPQRIEESSILDSEIPPSDEDDGQEYDLSMIVDATKQRIGESDQTALDLMAVPVDSPQHETKPQAYTLSQEVDYQILEQDYEEELTATQALNEEIARAAIEIAEQMERTSSGEDVTGDDLTQEYAQVPTDITAELPDTSDADITAEMTGNLPTRNAAVNDDNIGDEDDTGINEQLTAEMPVAQNDATVEMDVSRGRVKNKKSSG